ncbi:cytochrome P450 [Sporormia fimetaria CBS 119925]|uniref:Cytochrome P450 n=1 Tax=Sporormia fimetaria CBS 119925 TaxID=1340428 RepID=A0A6A6V332_9PLEO|nr:cytochrome P450 [Sporormia fimetaria CBS 119925]
MQPLFGTVPLAYVVIVIVAVGTKYIFIPYVLGRQSRDSHGRSLPPGPSVIPLLGNLKDQTPPGQPEWLHWVKHKDIYGPISSITVLGKTLIIINDAHAAYELLVKRSDTYADRLFLYFCGKLAGYTRSLGMCPYSERFKSLRKSMAKGVGSNATLSKVFNHVQEEEAVHLLLNLLQTPENIFEHIRKEAGAVILKIAYGYTVEPHGSDPLVDLAGKTMEDFADAGVPGKYVVDVMPFLDYLPGWFPGTAFKKVAKAYHARLSQSTEQPYQFVKQEMVGKRNKASFLSQALQSDPGNDDINKWAASSLCLGGADTTVSSLMTFFLVMMLYPKVQEKAQEEIDRVLRPTAKIPLRTDCENMLNINALVTELHRWHPVAPMAVPHSASRDDSYWGYRIPKGTIILTNTWWFTHDPAVYPEPDEFNPERFLGDTPQPDPRQWAFGYGRRVCPGRHIADNALLITVAQVLSVFSISKPTKDGKVIEPEVKFQAGVVTHPHPYQVDIRTRSPQHERIIREAEKQWPWAKSDREDLLSVRW